MKVGIIGAGASGMMAAISAAEHGYDVTLLERNSRPGYKVLQTGNGKCNYTNRQMNNKFYAESGRSLFDSVYSQFDFSKTINFFKNIGIVPYEKNGYFYPKSEQAKSIVDCLEMAMNKHKIRIIYDCDIVSVSKKDTFCIENSNNDYYNFDKLIIAAGSNAAPKTGSDGSGYGYAIKLGHKVKKPLPALCGLKCAGTDFKELSGIRCQAKVSLYVNKDLISEDFGELQHTEYGLSGIPVFQISGESLRRLDTGEKVIIQVDYASEYSYDELVSYLNERLLSLSDRSISKFLDGMYNSKLCNYLLKEVIEKYGDDHLVDSIDASFLIKSLVDKIKSSAFEVKGHRGFDNCQICTGGIYCDDVKNTLESRIVDGLYFCGEILDVDGQCGGYNLQWAWSSGYVAGKLM